MCGGWCVGLQGGIPRSLQKDDVFVIRQLQPYLPVGVYVACDNGLDAIEGHEHKDWRLLCYPAAQNALAEVYAHFCALAQATVKLRQTGHKEQRHAHNPTDKQRKHLRIERSL